MKAKPKKPIKKTVEQQVQVLAKALLDYVDLFDMAVAHIQQMEKYASRLTDRVDFIEKDLGIVVTPPKPAKKSRRTT
jgi:molecular chaperone GrpE (heat shock protein)